MKKSSPRFKDMGRECEYHWYEHPGIGRVEDDRLILDLRTVDPAQDSILLAQLVEGLGRSDR